MGSELVHCVGYCTSDREVSNVENLVWLLAVSNLLCVEGMRKGGRGRLYTGVYIYK
jgi:hypothetical protein